MAEGFSSGNAFKFGCMATFGVFAALFLTFCALPAACVMGTSGVASYSEARDNARARSESTTEPIETVETPEPTATPGAMPSANDDRVTLTVASTPRPTVRPLMTPSPTPDPYAQFYQAATAKQMQQAKYHADYYQYYADEAEKYQRHKKPEEQAEAVAKGLESKRMYEAVMSKEHYLSLVKEAYAKEMKRLKALEEERLTAPKREKARRDALKWNAYSEEYDKYRNRD